MCIKYNTDAAQFAASSPRKPCCSRNMPVGWHALASQIHSSTLEGSYANHYCHRSAEPHLGFHHGVGRRLAAGVPASYSLDC